MTLLKFIDIISQYKNKLSGLELMIIKCDTILGCPLEMYWKPNNECSMHLLWLSLSADVG